MYKPVQPTIRQSFEQVVYREILPDLKLQNYIVCYWELKTKSKLLSSFLYRVVADGCIDVYFEIQNCENNYVMGFCKKFTEFNLGQNFNYVGIRFYPTIFSQLFHVDAAMLSNQYTALNRVVPQLSEFIGGSLNSSMSFEDIGDRLNQFFMAWIKCQTFNWDKRLYKAIEIILINMGVVEIERDLDTGISQRQMRRLFEYYIGDTPKTFAKVVRFQNILNSKPSVQSLRESKLFYNAGYYDQAHFVKEFKFLYGVTPSQAFGR